MTFDGILPLIKYEPKVIDMMKLNQAFCISVALAALMLGCFSGTISGQSQAAEAIRLNEEARKLIKDKVGNAFRKCPNGDIYVLSMMYGGRALFQIQDLSWSIGGGPISSGEIDKKNGYDAKWSGSVTLTGKFYRRYRPYDNKWSDWDKFHAWADGVKKDDGPRGLEKNAGKPWTLGFLELYLGVRCEQVSALEKGDLDWEEFVVTTRAENGDKDILKDFNKAKEIGAALVQNQFCVCDGKHYRQSIINDFVDITEFEGMTWKMYEDRDVGGWGVEISSKARQTYSYRSSDDRKWFRLLEKREIIEAKTERATIRKHWDNRWIVAIRRGYPYGEMELEWNDITSTIPLTCATDSNKSVTLPLDCHMIKQALQSSPILKQ